jgi:Protein of unknown function (DUF2752)
MEITFIPRWILAWLFVDEDRRFHLNCAVSALLIVAGIPLLKVIPHICLAQTLLGIPCPGCGITHALAALGHFDLRAAWIANPAAMVVGLLFAFQIFARPAALFIPRISGNVSRAGRCLSAAAIFALMAVWVLRLI